jgi:CsoR family transcriptional regulator, copper-sensing transcriptional repressor
LPDGHARRKQVVLRLARIEGHVRGIKQMAEDDKPCPDIILQVNAVQSALQKVAVVLLEDHLEHCVLGADPDKVQDLLDEMREALSYFGR